MRLSGNYYKNGVLYDGYDYENQVWVQKGKYVRCGHPAEMQCDCYGRIHEWEWCKVGVGE
jgi:hypothetical protein